MKTQAPIALTVDDADHVRPGASGTPSDRPNELSELLAHRVVRQSLQPVVERLLALPAGGVFCIASAQADEGKTLVATALALMLSEETDRRTLLVDAHMQRPRIHVFFDAPESPGLADCLRDGRLAEAVSPAGKLSVLPAGRHDSGARLLFQTGTAKRLVEEMGRTYDVTLIDLPPLTSTSEAAALCDWSDGTILVVRANATRASAVATAVKMIGSQKILGVVLNQEQELPRWLQRLL